MIAAQLSSLDVLALTIYGEARGEPVEGQIAVGCVVRNRVYKDRDFRIICLEPKQFSCWNEDDSNYPILEDLSHKMMNSLPIINPELSQIRWVAAGIINNLILDNTGGSKNYLTTTLYYSNTIRWSATMKISKVIGKQIFLV